MGEYITSRLGNLVTGVLGVVGKIQAPECGVVLGPAGVNSSFKDSFDG